MRKLYSALLVVALSVAMVLPVLAAPSPKADTVAPASAVEVSVADANVKVLAADVKAELTNVVTNPTHVAVALKYEQEEMAAPRLIAKGTELIAKKIIEKISGFCATFYNLKNFC